MFEGALVSVGSEKPAVAESDGRQVVTLGRGEYHSRLAGESKVAAKHLVRTAFAEECCKLLGCRHGCNAIGSGGLEAGMGPMQCRVP